MKILALDPGAFEIFGNDVAVTGHYALVGAPNDRERGLRAGAVYLYDFSDRHNIRGLKITAFDGRPEARFGYSVAIDGEFAIIGAREDPQRGFSAGAAYVLDLRNPANILQHKLLPDEVDPLDVFGHDVAISGRQAIVGAFGDDDGGDNAGAVYLYDLADWGNIQYRKLTASDASVQATFGYSVAMDGPRVLVGARFDRNTRGAAYIYDTSTPNNIVEKKITPSDDSGGNVFAGAVALSGSLALIGAPQDGDGGTSTGAGKAYLYDVADLQQIKEFRLPDPDAQFGDQFGEAVAIHGSVAVVGARGTSAAADHSGAAYFFDVTDPNAMTYQRVTAFDGGESDLFGNAVAVDQGNIFVGSFLDDNLFEQAGSVYAYLVPEPSAASLCAPLAYLLAAGAQSSRRARIT